MVVLCGLRGSVNEVLGFLSGFMVVFCGFMVLLFQVLWRLCLPACAPARIARVKHGEHPWGWREEVGVGKM